MLVWRCAVVGTMSNLQAAKRRMARVRQPQPQQRPGDRHLFCYYFLQRSSSTMPRFLAANSTNRSSAWSFEKLRWVGLGALLLLYYCSSSSSSSGAGGIGAALGFSASSSTRTASSGSSFLRMSFLSSEEDGSLHSETSTAADTASDNDTSEDDFQYVFWLMPVEEDAQLLQTTIMDGLRQEYDAVSFAPHVTLGPPVSCSQIPDPLAALRTLTSGDGVTTTKATTATGNRSPRLRGLHLRYSHKNRAARRARGFRRALHAVRLFAARVQPRTGPALRAFATSLGARGRRAGRLGPLSPPVRALRKLLSPGAASRGGARPAAVSNDAIGPRWYRL